MSTFGCITFLKHSNPAIFDWATKFSNAMELSIDGQFSDSADILNELVSDPNTLEAGYIFFFYAFYLKGKNEAYLASSMNQSYATAIKTYATGFLELRKVLRAYPETSSRSSLSTLYQQFVYELCFCSIQLGNYNDAISLTEFALGSQDLITSDLLKQISLAEEKQANLIGFNDNELHNNEQYKLLQQLVWVHLFHTGNRLELKKVTDKSLELLDQINGLNFFVFHPFSSVVMAVAEKNFLKMLDGYLEINNGDLNALGAVKEQMERLYDAPYLQFLQWSAEQLGFYKNLRSQILGLGGYGYAMLGEYKKSRSLLVKAISSLEGCDLSDAENRLVLGMLYIGYADICLIPNIPEIPFAKTNYSQEQTRNIAEAKVYLQKGKDLLDPEKFKNNELEGEWGWFFAAWWREHFFLPYASIVLTKFYYKTGEWEKSFQESKNALESLDAASPKLLLIDAIYYNYFASRELTEKPDFNALSECKQKLAGYEGYEMWKIYYVESYLEEQKNNLVEAIALADKATVAVDKFWDQRFFDITNQIKFMEDKNIPYRRAIELQLRSEPKSVDNIFDYMEKVKSHSLDMKNGTADNKIKNIPGQKITIDALQQKLSSHEAVIELYYSSDYLISLFVSRTTADVVLISPEMVGSRDMNIFIKKLVDSFLQETSEYATGDEEHIKIGFKLYETLIACHQKNLDEHHLKKLYIVPHRQLHYLPWTALSISPKNENRMDYIIDHYEISVLPSAVAIKSLKDDSILSGQHCSDFFIGYDVAFTREEDVRQYDCSEFFKGKKVNKKNVLASLAEKEIVVLYAHGQFDGQPLSNGFDLTGDEDNVLTLLDLNNAHIKSKLVILPGCETGTAKRYTDLPTEGLDQQYPEDDNLLGLYKVLLSKGVANIVISAQKTLACEATDDFQVSMFSKVKRGKEACASFREAICEIKNNKRKPMYWSPYIFVGT